MNVNELKWGLKTPLIYNDPVYGQLELLFSGSCKYTLNDSSINLDVINEGLYNQINSSIVKIVMEFSNNESYNNVFNIVNDKLLSVFLNDFNNPNVDVSSVQVERAMLTDNSKNKISEYEKNKISEYEKNKSVVVQTDANSKDGQNKCPRCGATEISLNVNTGKLKCRFCRTEFDAEKVEGLDGDISQLQGQVYGSGATDIVVDTNDMITLKCSSCGAEVVVDTSTSAQSRCHWCRNTLSINQQIPNGSIPDVVLPFGVLKEEAKIEIEKFVGKRKFFANPKFKKEFTTDNIMGVYFPYMLVDVNSHVILEGQGEKLVRTYTVGSGDKKETRYDADLYNLSRSFDMLIDDLTIESNSDRLNNSQASKTNNVINAIMPFDTENCVKWNANYIKGYTSEKRDTNVEQLRELVELQSKDIARFAANKTIQEYNRGVAWSNEQLNIKGQQWKAAYLPVWLYSYQQVKGNKSILHYVAVNGRTRETMGSVPIHMPKLLLFSGLFELLGVLLTLFVQDDIRYVFLLLGFIFFGVMYFRYRNSNARHKHEKETKYNIGSITGNDSYVERRTGLRSPMMRGANNKMVIGKTNSMNVLNSLKSDNVNKVISNTITQNETVVNAINNQNDNNGN